MGAAVGEDGLWNRQCSLTVCRGASGCCPTQSSLSLSLPSARPVRLSVHPCLFRPSNYACRNPLPPPRCPTLSAYSLFLSASKSSRDTRSIPSPFRLHIFLFSRNSARFYKLDIHGYIRLDITFEGLYLYHSLTLFRVCGKSVSR